MTISAQTTDFSSVIGMKTPGATLPVEPIISAVATVDKANAITVSVSNVDLGGNLKYNLYMAANAHCDSQNPRQTINKYLDDAVWGMTHTNNPLPYTHSALPSTIPFCFIITSVNEAGVESVASNEVIVGAM